MERIDIAVEPLGTVRPAGIAPAIPADLLAEGDVDIDRHRFLHSDAIERGLQRCLTHGIGEFHRRGRRRSGDSQPPRADASAAVISAEAFAQLGLERRPIIDTLLPLSIQEEIGGPIDLVLIGAMVADLEQLVTQFNARYALTKDVQGLAIPRLALPANYAFGDNFHSLDLRLSRSFVFHERWRLSLIGEVFNLYNAANLSGYSNDLTSPGFGQPAARFTQLFGSGGPRAFQLATRVSF